MADEKQSTGKKTLTLTINENVYAKLAKVGEDLCVSPHVAAKIILLEGIKVRTAEQQG